VIAKASVAGFRGWPKSSTTAITACGNAPISGTIGADIPHKMKPPKCSSGRFTARSKQSPTAMAAARILGRRTKPPVGERLPHTRQCIWPTASDHRAAPWAIWRSTTCAGSSAAMRQALRLDLSKATRAGKLDIGYEAVAAE